MDPCSITSLNLRKVSRGSIGSQFWIRLQLETGLVVEGTWSETSVFPWGNFPRKKRMLVRLLMQYSNNPSPIFRMFML